MRKFVVATAILIAGGIATDVWRGGRSRHYGSNGAGRLNHGMFRWLSVVQRRGASFRQRRGRGVQQLDGLGSPSEPVRRRDV